MIELSVNKKELLRSYYDQNAKIYDRRHGVVCAGQDYNFVRHYQPFLGKHVPAHGQVLELGCGTGVYTQWLIERGCAVVAMDISPEMIEGARARAPQAQYFCGDCENPAALLPKGLREEAFDAIVGINTFSYYPHKLEALQNYAELLRTGGRVVFIDMNGACPIYRVMKWIGKNEMPQWFQEVRESRASCLKEMIKQSGFALREMSHFAFIPNGVSSRVVSFFRPFDELMGSMRIPSRLAMRIAICAEKS